MAKMTFAIRSLWRTTWTPAQINASNFGTAHAISSNGSGNGCNVDWHKVTVYYTAVGWARKTLSLLGVG